MIRLIVDCTREIGSAEARELGIISLPMRMMIDDQEYLAGENLDNDTFYDLLPKEMGQAVRRLDEELRKKQESRRDVQFSCKKADGKDRVLSVDKEIALIGGFDLHALLIGRILVDSVSL